MKIFFTFVMTLTFATAILGQESSREQKFMRIKDLHAQVTKIAEELFRPDPADIKVASGKALHVFRLMPRELVSRSIVVPREGGSYYSFTTRSNEYGSTSQIGLEQKYLKTGFAGADYGLIAELGNIELAEVELTRPEVDFLMSYKAPKNILEARTEKSKSYEYKIDSFTLRSRVPVVIGNTYAIRAIVYEEADTLVLFKVVRQDTDGSLIINWKTVSDFEKPSLDLTIKEN